MADALNMQGRAGVQGRAVSSFAAGRDDEELEESLSPSRFDD